MVYIGFMRTVLTTEVFDIWFARLKDARARARARISAIKQALELAGKL
jgi:hypothetical protein